MCLTLAESHVLGKVLECCFFVLFLHKLFFVKNRQYPKVVIEGIGRL